MSGDVSPYIFIDTCSLLDSCWNRVAGSSDESRYEFSRAKEERFWITEFSSLEAMGMVIIPKRNYEELVKHSNNTKKPGLSQRAKIVLNRIGLLHREGRIQIIGDPNDPFADAILLSVALKFRTQRNMAFITQDRKLAEDLEAIRHFRSVCPRKGLDIKIRRIARDGALEEHRGLRNSLYPDKRARPSRFYGDKRMETSANWWDA